MSRVVSWLVAIGILVIAGVVVALEPPEQLEQAPFIVNTRIGEEGVGRNIQATFSDVRLANVVELDEFEGWRGTTEGVWVVATIDVQSRVDSTGVTSFLLIDDLEFRGSERLDLEGLESWRLLAGIPTTGTVLFEIPRELADRTTEARVMIGTSSDWRLDSVISTTVDLSALDVQPTVLVAPAARVAP